MKFNNFTSHHHNIWYFYSQHQLLMIISSVPKWLTGLSSPGDPSWSNIDRGNPLGGIMPMIIDFPDLLPFIFLEYFFLHVLHVLHVFFYFDFCPECFYPGETVVWESGRLSIRRIFWGKKDILGRKTLLLTQYCNAGWRYILTRSLAKVSTLQRWKLSNVCQAGRRMECE